MVVNGVLQAGMVPWNPRGNTYLNLVEVEIDGLGAHANIVSDDIQDKGVHRLGRV